MTGVIASIAIRAASMTIDEAIARRRRREHRKRRLAVAAEDRHVEIRLLRLRRHAGRGAGALHVDDDERQLGRDRKAERLGLQRKPRPGASAVTPSPPA